MCNRSRLPLVLGARRPTCLFKLHVLILSFSVLFFALFFSLKSEDSIAYKEGSIQQGDKLLEVNGISLKKATQEEACKALRVS